MESIRRALVLGLVLKAGTAIEQAPSVGPLKHIVPCIVYLYSLEYSKLFSLKLLQADKIYCEEFILCEQFSHYFYNSFPHTLFKQIGCVIFRQQLYSCIIINVEFFCCV